MTDPYPFAPSPPIADRRHALKRRIACLFFSLGLAVALCGALVYGLVTMPSAAGLRHASALACLAQAVVFGAGLVVVRRHPARIEALRLAVLLSCASGAATLVLSALASGDGVHALALGFLAALTGIGTVFAGGGAGAALAIGCAAAVAGLAVIESRSGAHAALPGSPALVNLLTLVLMLACAVVAGLQVRRIVRRANADAEERDRRFANLLGIGADWYWELDEQLRYRPPLTELVPHVASLHASRVGLRPWEVDEVQWTPESIDAHRTLLEAHQPFNDLAQTRREANGRLRFYRISGRPHVDAQGRFRGYWGVGRDETEAVLARQAVTASENRYKELFTRSPSPLILHRRGLVIDANDAAAGLFGFASAAAMTGTELLTLITPGVHRERAKERLAHLESLPVGSALEVTDYDMNAADGARLSVQATGVRVNSADGAASLSIYFDITARSAAESALRRSEGMLSHLFANSPDFITMSELHTGRYVMVNPSFCRIFGYSAREVVGRTAQELGTWLDPNDGAKVVSRLMTDGIVHDQQMWLATKSGAPVALMMSAGRLRMDGRDYMVVNGRDVTDTQRARLEHEAILQSASLGIALVRERRFSRTNPSFEAMFGWPAGTLTGQPASVVGAEEADFVRDLDQLEPRLAAGAPVEVERPMRRRDGSTFWCRLLAQVVDPAHPRLGGTIWIAEDVTERRRVDQALADARDAAEAANRAKSAFLANTSHEIRTPLNGLLGLARLAMQPNVDEVRRGQYLEQIHDSARSLADIISDILDLSKIEAGKFSIESAPFDLRKLLSAVHHAYRSLSDGRALSLTLRVANTVPSMVRGDPVRVRQVLSNYITNALKFTEHGTVEIAASVTSAGWVRLIVSDTGPGIAADVQQRLFRPFTQADESTTRRYGGTGLGLSICKELAELMGGRCGVQSRLGAGSSFWVELPLPSAQPGPADADPKTGTQLAGLDVLLVEDNPVNMMIGVALLEQWGMNVGQALDGHEAVLAVDRAAQAGHPFDVVLMDVHMPRLSGYEAAAELRTRYSSRRLPIIALTAAALVSEREQALAAGMDDFLTKPIDPSKLRRALLQALSPRLSV